VGVAPSLDYYRFLAAKVAPPRLASAALRRAVRTARNRLLPPLEPDPERLLHSLGCRTPVDLAELLSRPRPAPPPFTPATLRQTFERHLAGEAERALERARDVERGLLPVYGRRVPAGKAGALDWQRDFLNGGSFDAAAPSSRVLPVPGLDPKAAWALARGDGWVALACGAALDPGSDAFPRALSASVSDFVDRNPFLRGVHWASAMEAGLRAFNLLLALWVSSIRGPPDPSLSFSAARLFVSSGRFIRAHLEDDGAVPNNHLTCDLLGLLSCAEALPEWPEARRWRQEALAGLRRAAAEQVLPDGLSFEGSLPYHRFSLEVFAAAALLAHRARHGLGRPYAAALRSMFRATRALTARCGELPQIGDNDSGSALAVRLRGPTEAAHLLPLGAALFQDPSLLVKKGASDAAEVAWLLGPRALDFVRRSRPGPSPPSAAFGAGGFHAVRRGSLEAFVSCGPSGQRGIGGHSHNDKLSLELFVGGHRTVCDPGMPVYGRDPALRDRFRSTAAHATVVVDGLEQCPIPPGRLFALPDRADARLLLLERCAAADHLAGEHAGYARRCRVVHRRDVFVAESGALVLDRLSGAGGHTFELRWPLEPQAVRLRDTSPGERQALSTVARLGKAEIDLSRAVEVALGEAGTLLLAFSAPFAPELVPAPRSPGYGEVRPGTAVRLAGPAECPFTMATAFALLPRPSNGLG